MGEGTASDSYWKTEAQGRAGKSSSMKDIEKFKFNSRRAKKGESEKMQP